jgi:UDP-N-acetylglucosamine 3-dehydrogenase
MKRKLGLIGRGRWGKNIERTLLTFPDVALTVVGRGEQAPKDLDGVLVATPGSTHKEIALPFIERGIPTFVEKPFTTSVADALALQTAAEKSGALVFVGHIHLYNPPFLKIKELLPSLGPVRFMFSEGMNNGPVRDDMSVMWDWLPHDLSMAIELLGSVPVAVEASAVNVLRPELPHLYDIASATFTFKEGIKLFSNVSWISPIKRKRLIVVGEKSTLVFDDTAEKKLILYKNLGPHVEGNRVALQEAHLLYPDYDKISSLECELRAFVEMVTAKKVQSLNTSVAIVRAIEAAHKAVGEGVIL